MPLRSWLPFHNVETAWERGWSTLSNAELLLAAEKGGFDLLITTDRELRYQQNLEQRRVAVLVLMVANWPALEPRARAIDSIVEEMQPGQYAEWSPP